MPTYPNLTDDEVADLVAERAPSEDKPTMQQCAFLLAAARCMPESLRAEAVTLAALWAWSAKLDPERVADRAEFYFQDLHAALTAADLLASVRRHPLN